jgi:hypothetical protein
MALEEIAAKLDACGDLAYICSSPSRNNNMMHTIRLRVDDRVYQNLMWLLGKFSKEEIQVIEENGAFLSVKEYLSSQLAEAERDSAGYMDIDQLDEALEATLRKYEA